MDPREKISENGMREAISNIKNDVNDLFDRIHDIEISGCPMGNSIQKQVTEMKDEIRILTREIYKTSALVAAIVVIAQILIKFL